MSYDGTCTKESKILDKGSI